MSMPSEEQRGWVQRSKGARLWPVGHRIDRLLVCVRWEPWRVVQRSDVTQFPLQRASMVGQVCEQGEQIGGCCGNPGEKYWWRGTLRVAAKWLNSGYILKYQPTGQGVYGKENEGSTSFSRNWKGRGAVNRFFLFIHQIRALPIQEVTELLMNPRTCLFSFLSPLVFPSWI